MATLKYSRQREAIKEYLSHTKEHPSADTVYLHIKKEFPNISLGTVYRNLNLLVDTGDIIKITFSDGGDRFDGATTPHYHFFCSECGKVLDLNFAEMERINQLANEQFDGVIEFHETKFHGRCGDCIRNARVQYSG